MTVSECVCHAISFRRLLEVRDRIDPDHQMCDLDALGALRSRTGCSSSCAMCRPYILLALRTGRTELPVLPSRRVREIERDARAAAGGAP